MLMSTRLSAGVCLAAVVFLTACSSTKTPTVAVETEMAVRTATTIPEPSPEVTQRSGEATAYPGPSDEPAQGGSAETAYPGPATQPVQRNSAGTAYPAPGSYPGPAQGNTVQSPQQSAYPAPGSSGQNQATTTPSPYPGPEIADEIICRLIDEYTGAPTRVWRRIHRLHLNRRLLPQIGRH